MSKRDELRGLLAKYNAGIDSGDLDSETAERLDDALWEAKDDLLAVVDAAQNAQDVRRSAYHEQGDLVSEAYAELDAALARVTEGERVEPREGIVTVYDHAGKYLGCMGIETWQRLVTEGGQT